MTPRVRPILCLLLTALTLWAQEPASAPSDNPDNTAALLSDTPTTDPAWGISFHAPLYTHTRREPTGKYLMQVADDDEKFSILLMVRQMGDSPTLAKFSKAVRDEVEIASTITNLLSEREAAFDGRVAVVNYYQVPDPLRPAGYRLVGQAIVQIARGTFVVVELTCALEDEKPNRKAFEAMLQSLKFSDPQELESRRKAAVQLGSDFLSRVTPEKLHAALVPDRYFRIVESRDTGDPTDVGWMRMSQSRGDQNGKPGVVVSSASRWLQEGVYHDALERFFLADDDSLELWTVTVTRRKPGEKISPAVNRDTLNEVGIRTQAQVLVTIDSPLGSEKVELTRPDTAYLSRIHAILLPQLLPADLPATYAFYHYHPTQRKVVLRTDQLSPTFNGYTLLTTPALNEQPHTSTFDAKRRPTAWSLSPTRSLVPTTAADLKKRWPDQ